MTVRTSERRIENTPEVMNLLVQHHGETRERLVRIEDKVDVLVDDLAEAKVGLGALRGDVAALKGDVAGIEGGVAAIKTHLDQMSRSR